MRYFKVKTGYGEMDFVSVDENELEIALFIFINDSKAIFKNGVVRGKDILGITEDFNREMGWHASHRIDEYDQAELREKGVYKKYAGVIEAAKIKVHHLIQTRQTDLIGKGVSVPELSAAKLK